MSFAHLSSFWKGPEGGKVHGRSHSLLCQVGDCLGVDPWWSLHRLHFVLCTGPIWSWILEWNILFVHIKTIKVPAFLKINFWLLHIVTLVLKSEVRVGESSQTTLILFPSLGRMRQRVSTLVARTDSANTEGLPANVIYMLSFAANQPSKDEPSPEEDAFEIDFLLWARRISLSALDLQALRLVAGGKGLTVATLAGKRAAQAFKEQSRICHMFSGRAFGQTSFIFS